MKYKNMIFTIDEDGIGTITEKIGNKVIITSDPVFNRAYFLYRKDKHLLSELHFNKKDNNDYYMFMVRLMYNSFITNHILIDGNKRMFKKEMEELNKKVTEKSLE